MLKKWGSPKAKRAAIGLLLGCMAVIVELLLAKTVLSPRDVHPIALSCTLHILLWVMIVYVIRRDSSIRFEKLHYAVILLSCAMLIAYYGFMLKERGFVYYWDYGCYYGMQISFRNPFRGLARGLRSWAGTFAGDYTQFMNAFFELPYRLIGSSAEAFVLACCVTIFPPLLTCVTALIQKIAALAKVKRKKLFYLLAYAGMATMPLLHWSLAHGMPDAFGLIFALLIMLVTLDYRFEKIELGRWVVLLASVIALALSRRWYLYWIVGYVALYAVGWSCWVAARAFRKQSVSEPVRNAFLFMLPSLALIFVLLRPMILHILSYDYGRYYSFYSAGGMLHELQSQLNRIGWLPALLMGLGVVWGLFCTRTRWMTGAAIAGFGTAVSLFVSVQNTGWHQNLLALPFLWMLVIMGCMACCEGKRRVLCGVLSGAAAGVFLLQTLFGFLPGLSAAQWLSSGNLWEEERNDLETVKEVANWIDENCEGEEYAYMVPHGVPYNPDVFRVVLRPDRRIEKVLTYGSAVPGTHSFPIELFDAKYVLTCEPFCRYGLAEKYNEEFLHQVRQGKFELEKTFDMGNGYLFYAYRRVMPADLEEIETYRSAFAEENKAFPENFDRVFDAYVTNMQKN